MPTDLDDVPVLPPLVALSWAALAESDEAIETAEHIELRVANLSREDLEAELTYTADDGAGTTTHVAVGRLAFAAGDTRTVAIDLGASGIALRNLPYSGRMHVSLSLHRPGVRRARAANSPPLYYHPHTDGRLWIYTETALRVHHKDGDFRRRDATEHPTDADLVIDRIIHGGAGVSALAPHNVDSPEA